MLPASILSECAGRMAGGGIIELVDMAWDYDVVGEFYAMMQGMPLGDPPPVSASRENATPDAERSPRLPNTICWTLTAVPQSSGMWLMRR